MIDNICIGATTDGKNFFRENFKEFKEEIFKNSNIHKHIKISGSSYPNIVRVKGISFTDENYLALLLEDILESEEVEELVFIKCNFEIHEIYDIEKKLVFESCTFREKINPLTKLTSGQKPRINIIFYQCEFHEDIDAKHYIYLEKLEVELIKFINCNIKKINLENIEILGDLFISNQNTYEDIKIEAIDINSCTLKKPFNISNNTIEKSIQIENCFFEKKVDLRNTNIDKIIIKSSNFLDIVDFHGTKSEHIEVTQCVFENFFGFEECTIDGNQEKPSAFKYTTFKNLASFRGSTFKDGLDLSKTNALGRINFLDIDVSLNDTKRETFRLIKHTLDSEGNYLEANKFFALELDKYREDIKGKEGKCIDKTVYFFNKYISDFGRNYVWASLWVLGLMGLMCFTNFLYEKGFPYNQIPWTRGCILKTINILNEFSKNYLILGKILPEGREFISLLITLAMTACMWQLVVALKRYTRR